MYNLLISKKHLMNGTFFLNIYIFQTIVDRPCDLSVSEVNQPI